MSDINPILEALTKSGQNALAAQLAALPPGPAQELVLEAFAAAFEIYAPVLTQAVEKRIETMINDADPAVVLDWAADWRAASASLVPMERQEADAKSASRDMLTQVAATVGPIVAGVLRSLIPIP